MMSEQDFADEMALNECAADPRDLTAALIQANMDEPDYAGTRWIAFDRGGWPYPFVEAAHQ